MGNLSRLPRPFLMSLFLVLVALDGCASNQPAPAANAGTTSMVQLPESDPPILTQALADRIRTGMSQKDALSILRDAGRGSPSAGSLLENAYAQGMLNTLRYDLTVAQGKRKLVLAFRSAKLEGKTVEGMD